jgi:hypothetical protein
VHVVAGTSNGTNYAKHELCGFTKA